MVADQRGGIFEKNLASASATEDWGKLIGDVPSATAILDRFRHHAEVITITGKSYGLRNQARRSKSKQDQTGSQNDENDKA